MKVPYAMCAAVATNKRHAQMALALQYGWPRLQQTPIDDSKSLTLACYGPSLADTYQTMTHPILSMSGATKWLAEHGVIADYHVDMDPRPHKIECIRPPVPGVHYLMATVCHPDSWPLLKDQKVTLWHTYSAEETYKYVAEVDGPGELVIRGGSTIGLTALHVGGVLGYRHFEIHGMDGSFRDETRLERHAGPHTGTKQNKDQITWDVFRKPYYTSRIMANAVSETLQTVENFPIFCVFHGEGLTQALIRKRDFRNACCADEYEKATRVRNSIAIIQPTPTPTPADIWRLVCGEAKVTPELEELARRNEARRRLANYNTGSIPLAQMAQLRGFSELHHPRVVVEIGTFIGNSTMAIQSEHIYTCDRSNDCLESTERIHTYPGKSSTEMLAALATRHLKVDLFYFDGRIQLPDLALILKLSHSRTVYLFDDYVPGEKGMANVALLGPVLPGRWVIMPPLDARDSKLAAMVPGELVGVKP